MSKSYEIEMIVNIFGEVERIVVNYEVIHSEENDEPISVKEAYSKIDKYFANPFRFEIHKKPTTKGKSIADIMDERGITMDDLTASPMDYLGL